jgi:hypothetical protein
VVLVLRSAALSMVPQQATTNLTAFI